ncbi:MAG: hypothetical protein KC635_00495 [Myxococcales bacterium]|nr:hypothetical protein [Myxococcales bacterium]MCB9736582.1 hypothetical protein [Deltaproteobacteria bacterium]
MFDSTTPPPVMRGDLFALLDPDAEDAAVTPVSIAANAQRLVELVTLGERAPGTPAVMRCLEDIAELGDDGTTVGEAFTRLAAIRRALVALGDAKGHVLPWPRLRDRTVVLPQKRSASVVRTLPAGEGYFVLTCEASEAKQGAPSELPAGEPDRDDVAIGAAIVPPVDTTFRLFRFGGQPSDIRLVMRIVQEAGTYRPVLAHGDGSRVAVVSRDVVGIFDESGTAVLSGRVPLDMGVDSGSEVTSVALEGDVLALNLRPAGGRPVELALMNLTQKKGFPIGVVGDEASAMVLGERSAFVVDGLNLLRVPLFQNDATIEVLRLRPWFAEYPWSPHNYVGWDAGRVWVSNGRKLVVVADDLSAVLGELSLPEPIVDMHVRDGEMVLVTHDAGVSVATIAVYDVS